LPEDIIVLSNNILEHPAEGPLDLKAGQVCIGGNRVH